MRTIKKGGHRLFEHDSTTAEVVSRMLLDLERRGMDAVREYSQRFDGWNPSTFELSPAEIRTAIDIVDEQVRQDTDLCQANVRKFAEAQLKTLLPLEVEISPGVTMGHRHMPVGRVGSYIPGGRYPMFGSAQMSIIPARVAGVGCVIASTPPVKGKGYYPPTINAICQAGASRIFVVGGVPAMAMMAFGLADVEPVDIICGAGNKFVAEAKRQLFGRCGIDLLAGPTEILVIADDTADPRLVACDLLAQAEHDPHCGICLVSTDERTALECLAQIQTQLAVLPTKEVAEESWRDYGVVTLVDSINEAIAYANEYAPEHLHLHVSHATEGRYIDRLENYGSLFIGEETTVAFGDKGIGTNHILPTGRSARYTGGAWVGTFLKTCTFQKCTRQASVEFGKICDRQCRAEGMLAHAISARERVVRMAWEF